MDLVEFLRIRAEKYSEKPLLFGEEMTVSYRAFDEITDRIAYGLEKIGVASGDPVAVLHPNSVQTLLAYFSIIKVGGVVIPVNPIYTAREISFILNNSEAKAIILHEAFLSTIERMRREI